MASIQLHSRNYKVPHRPCAIICVDGFDPEYLEQGIQDGILPNLARMVKSGFHTTGKVAMPTFTNPNNVSIITGVPTSVHGIAGNFYLDPVTLQERMVLDDTLLRGSTILEQLSLQGVRIAAVTAKDKLRCILQHGLRDGTTICFSAQYADKCTIEENGIAEVESYVGRPAPSQYSGDLSLFVLDAGIKLLEDDRADVFYLTLSDFIQHKFAPGDNEANAFLQAIDTKIGQLLELGAVVGVTGDHGMSDKCLDDGTPNVLFVQDELEAKFGTDCARVICPITDPFVRHHGALGSFVRIHLPKNRQADRDAMIEYLRKYPQVDFAVDGADAAARWEMPLDREGDIVLVSVKNAVLGATVGEHAMESITDHRLRSHGGLSEQDVPVILSVPKGSAVGADEHWHNYDIFDLVLNSA